MRLPGVLRPWLFRGGSLDRADPIVTSATDLAGDYQRRPDDSPLGHIFETAARWIETLDAVLFVGEADDLSASRILLDACADPWHNERDRADRGGRPRRYWLSPGDDHDAVASVVERLCHRRPVPPVGLAILGGGSSPSPPVTRLVDWLTDAIQLRAVGNGLVDDNRKIFQTAHFPGRVPVGPPALFAAAVAGLDVMRWLGGVHAVTLASRDYPHPPAASDTMGLHGHVRFCSDHASLARFCCWINHRPSAAPPGQSTPQEQVVKIVIARHRHDEYPPREATTRPAVVELNDQPSQIIVPSLTEHTVGQLIQIGQFR